MLMENRIELDTRGEW